MEPTFIMVIYLSIHEYIVALLKANENAAFWPLVGSEPLSPWFVTFALQWSKLLGLESNTISCEGFLAVDEETQHLKQILNQL